MNDFDLEEQPSPQRRWDRHGGSSDVDSGDKLSSSSSSSSKRNDKNDTTTSHNTTTTTTKEESATLQEVLYEWADETSIHGLESITNYRWFTRWKRLMWMIVFVISLSCMIWQSTILIEDFVEYRTITSTQTIVPPSISFPQITFCSTNSVDRVRKEQQTTNLIGNNPTNEEELLLVTRPSEEFFVATAFNEEKLNVTESWTPIITDYGACWTFLTDEPVYTPGPSGGLEVIVWLGQDNFERIVESAGVRIFIHQPGTNVTYQMPFTFVTPGGHDYVDMTKIVWERERDVPWSTCQSEAPEYTQASCRSVCFHTAVRETCGCRSLGDSTTNTTDLNFCFSLTDKACMRSQAKSISNCPCQIPPCYEETFDTRNHEVVFSKQVEKLLVDSTASAATPDDAIPNDDNTLFASTIDRIKSLWMDSGNRSDTTIFYDNLFAVTINYQTLGYEVRTETKSQTFTGLLASLGGTFGLWIGASVISFFELFGDLVAMRLIPRLFGDKRLYGLGGKTKSR